MLYLVSYENADPGQDMRVREVLAKLNAKHLLGHTWVFETFKGTVLDVLWSIRLGENMKLLVADVSHAHFATSPYSDIRSLVRQPPPAAPVQPVEPAEE
jgi:hypothetical protein